MSANVKVLKIEATSPLDAIKQIKAQLGDEIPDDVLLRVLHEMAEHSNVEQDAKDAGFDMDAEAQRIADLPAHERKAALEEATLRLGKAAGLSDAEAAAKTKEVSDFLTGLMGADLPDWMKTDEVRKIKDDFLNALGKIHSAGYDDTVIRHIEWFRQNQPKMMEALGALGELGCEPFRHRPSAQLGLDVMEYMQKSNEFIFSVLKQSNVNPETLGFKAENEWRKCLPGFEEAKNLLRKMLA